MTFFRISCVFFSLFYFTPFVVAQQQTGSTDPDSVFFQSLRLQQAGQYDEARTLLRGLLSRFPLYYDARIVYGRLLAWDSQYNAALSQIDSVLSFQPMNAEARLTKAQILAWSKRYRTAADILRVLAEEDPATPLYRTELAKVYLWGGSPQRALEEYEQAYLQDPASPEVMRGLARAHRELRSFELSRYWYGKLLERVPGDAEAQSEIIGLSYRSAVEIQVQGSYEAFSAAGSKPHSVAQAEVFASPAGDWKPFVHFSRVSKYSETDYRLGLGSYVTLDYAVGLLAQGIVSPKARVAPSLDLLAELTWGIADGIELVGGYRFVRFDSVRVHVLQPGFTWYLRGDTRITVKEYVGLASVGTTSNSTVATIHYAPDPLTVIRLGGFTGTEAFRATTLSELSAIKTSGGFAGLKSRISGAVAIEILYQYTARNVTSDSHLGLLTLSFLL